MEVRRMNGLRVGASTQATCPGLRIRDRHGRQCLRISDPHVVPAMMRYLCTQPIGRGISSELLLS